MMIKLNARDATFFSVFDPKNNAVFNVCDQTLSKADRDTHWCFVDTAVRLRSLLDLPLVAF